MRNLSVTTRFFASLKMTSLSFRLTEYLHQRVTGLESRSN